MIFITIDISCAQNINILLIKESNSGHKKSILVTIINSSKRNLLSWVALALSTCGFV